MGRAQVRRLTPAAGSFQEQIEWRLRVASLCDGAKCRLRRTNDTAATLVVGSQELVTSSFAQATTQMVGSVTLTAGDTIELQAWSNGSAARFGRSTRFGGNRPMKSADIRRTRAARPFLVLRYDPFPVFARLQRGAREVAKHQEKPKLGQSNFQPIRLNPAITLAG